MCWCGREKVFIANGGCEGNNLDAIGLAQVLLCDCTGSDSSFTVLDADSKLDMTCDSPMVSRALLLPPPELAFTPYFSR